MLGVCIRYFHPNYGGMLQSYATTQILNKRGLEYELIRYEKKKNAAFIIRSIPRLFNPILLNDKYLLLSKKINFVLHKEFKKNERKRREKFRQFEKEEFAKDEIRYVGYEALCEAAKKYDAIITGSDQLWSPSGLESNFFNLMFVPEEIKKISLASSFGVSRIPKNQIKRTKQYLSRIMHISMRENRGAEIVMELTGRDVPVILDPVFMLKKEEWEDIATTKRFCDSPYLFAYLLGASTETRHEISEYAKKQGLKIITLRHANQYVKEDEFFGDIAPYEVGPREFLSLIKNADCVCTDSYHGCVFSVLFHKPFAVYNRYVTGSVNSKNSRIDTICHNLKLNDRRRTEKNTLSTLMEKSVNYSEVDRLLGEKRKDFDSYLDNALRI